jgi:hypothetical protein
MPVKFSSPFLYFADCTTYYCVIASCSLNPAFYSTHMVNSHHLLLDEAYLVIIWLPLEGACGSTEGRFNCVRTREDGKVPTTIFCADGNLLRRSAHNRFLLAHTKGHRHSGWRVALGVSA